MLSMVASGPWAHGRWRHLPSTRLCSHRTPPPFENRHPPSPLLHSGGESAQRVLRCVRVPAPHTRHPRVPRTRPSHNPSTQDHIGPHTMRSARLRPYPGGHLSSLRSSSESEASRGSSCVAGRHTHACKDGAASSRTQLDAEPSGSAPPASHARKSACIIFRNSSNESVLTSPSVST